jgi:transcriptional regulator with XRE-family HTH domain
MNDTFGAYVRKQREALADAALPSGSMSYSLRAVAGAVGVEPSYLSKVERGTVPPSDDLVEKLASVLGEDMDVLMALAGKVSRELQDIIVRRPRLFASLLRELRDAPEHAILRVVREVRDGQW